MIRNLSREEIEGLEVVNSFQNFIFKDDSQHIHFQHFQWHVVNSFQNFIFKDDSQHSEGGNVLDGCCE